MKSNTTLYKHGDICTITHSMDVGVNSWVNELCVFDKITKSGLYQIRLLSDRRKTQSVTESQMKHIWGI